MSPNNTGTMMTRSWRDKEPRSRGWGKKTRGQGPGAGGRGVRFVGRFARRAARRETTLDEGAGGLTRSPGRNDRVPWPLAPGPRPLSCRPSGPWPPAPGPLLRYLLSTRPYNFWLIGPGRRWCRRRCRCGAFFLALLVLLNYRRQERGRHVGELRLLFRGERLHEMGCDHHQ